MRIVVYGTLREGEVRDQIVQILRETGWSKITELTGIKMYSLGPYPAAVITNDPNDVIIAEVIEGYVSEEYTKKLMAELDAIEGVRYGLYKREVIETEWGPASIYVYGKEIPKDAPAIKDWVEWRHRKVRNKSMKV